MPRSVDLFAEHREDGSSLYLRARVSEEGDLRIEGQDLGPVTAAVSSDGEYEYLYTIQSEDVAALGAALGGEADDDILEVLKDSWSGAKSHGLEEAIRHSGVPFTFSCYS